MFDRQQETPTASRNIFHAMKEKIFQAELIDGARALKMHVVNLLNGVVDPEGRWNVRKPYDLGLVYQGRYAGLELKQVRSGNTLAMSKIESHQFMALQNCAANGGLAFIVINFRMTFTPKQANHYGVPRINQTWAVPITHWKYSASISINDLRDTGCPYPQLPHCHVYKPADSGNLRMVPGGLMAPGKKQAWNPRPLFEEAAC